MIQLSSFQLSLVVQLAVQVPEMQLLLEMVQLSEKEQEMAQSITVLSQQMEPDSEQLVQTEQVQLQEAESELELLPKMMDQITKQLQQLEQEQVKPTQLETELPQV